MVKESAYFEVLFDFTAEGEVSCRPSFDGLVCLSVASVCLHQGELSVNVGEIVVAHPGADGEFGTGDDIRDGWLMVQIEGSGTFGE
jgi:hypothetical protein